MKIDTLLELYPDQDLIQADGLDGAIIGVDEVSMRVVYSVSKVIQIFMEEGMTEEEALEFYYYNVERAAPYVENAPIFCHDINL